MRPKQENNTATFFSLISRDTSEERFGQNRQLFLTEQGYEYEIYTLDQFQETGLLSEADRFPAQAISEPVISGV